MITLKPRLSEKTYGLSQTTNTYVFDVPVSANKQMIATSVEQLYKVAVIDVNTTRKTGKVKRSVRKRTQPVSGQETTTKQAYVTLKKGDKISLFEEGA